MIKEDKIIFNFGTFMNGKARTLSNAIYFESLRLL